MVIARVVLVPAVRRRAQPLEVLAHPALERGAVRLRPARRAAQQLRGVHRLDEPSRVDDSAAALLRIPAHELREAEILVHVRGRIEEPGTELLAGPARVAGIAREVPGEGERLDVAAHRGDARLVEVCLAFRIRLAVAPDVRE